MTDQPNDGAHRALIKERADHKQSKELLKQARDRLTTAERQIAEGGIVANPTSERVSQFIADSVKAKLAEAMTEQLGRIAALEAELTEARAAGETFKQSIACKTIEAALHEAATKAHILPTAVGDVVKLGKLDAQVSDDGTVAMADGRTVDDFIEGLKESSPYFWPPAVGSGGPHGRGARGSMHPSEFGPSILPADSNNPFQAGPSWNLTRQGELLRSSPAQAAKLQEQAKV